MERLLLLPVQRHYGRRRLDASFVPQQEQEAKDGSVGRHAEDFKTKLGSCAPSALESWRPQKRGTFRSAQGTVQRVSAPFQHSIQHTAGLQTPPASRISSSVLLGFYRGVMPSPQAPSRSPFRVHAAPSPLPAALT